MDVIHKSHHSFLDTCKIVFMLIVLLILLVVAVFIQGAFKNMFPNAPQEEITTEPAAMPTISGDVVYLNIDSVMKIWRRSEERRLASLQES